MSVCRQSALLNLAPLTVAAHASRSIGRLVQGSKGTAGETGANWRLTTSSDSEPWHAVRSPEDRESSRHTNNNTNCPVPTPPPPCSFSDERLSSAAFSTDCVYLFLIEYFSETERLCAKLGNWLAGCFGSRWCFNWRGGGGLMRGGTS